MPLRLQHEEASQSASEGSQPDVPMYGLSDSRVYAPNFFLGYYPPPGLPPHLGQPPFDDILMAGAGTSSEPTQKPSTSYQHVGESESKEAIEWLVPVRDDMKDVSNPI
jgi:hypothetical protein